jgi:hypothetical protein
MDFNELQSAWKNESNKNIQLPTNLDTLRTANTPLDKIRKNLKNEFIYQISAILLIGFVPMYSSFPEKMVAGYYLLYAVMVAISVYYLAKLFFFFKRINNTVLNTKDSLFETYTDIMINMELYKTFSFALTPFLVVYLLGSSFYESQHASQLLSGDISTKILMVIVGVVVFSILFMAIATEWWVNHFYGKYAKEIRKVIDEIKE